MFLPHVTCYIYDILRKTCTKYTIACTKYTITIEITKILRIRAMKYRHTQEDMCIISLNSTKEQLTKMRFVIISSVIFISFTILSLCMNDSDATKRLNRSHNKVMPYTDLCAAAPLLSLIWGAGVEHYPSVT